MRGFSENNRELREFELIQSRCFRTAFSQRTSLHGCESDLSQSGSEDWPKSVRTNLSPHYFKIRRLDFGDSGMSNEFHRVVAGRFRPNKSETLRLAEFLKTSSLT